MGLEIPNISYSGKIKEVTLGQGEKKIVVGGENCFAFHRFEGKIPKNPVLAMEIWDIEPEDWPDACLNPIAEIVNKPDIWAKKCVEEFGAEAIVIQLKSTDPNGLDATPEKASETVNKVISAVKVPIIIWGSANSNKDAETLKHIAKNFNGKNLLLGPVDEGNYKIIGAAALAYEHSIIASTPIDVNLAKQLNILLTNLGIPLNRIIIDPTTGGLGYGLEYTYSVMERIRMAALLQNDESLTLPMINNVGNEVWKSKEAKLINNEKLNLGNDSMRGVLMEATAAVSFMLAGSNILIIRHPKTISLLNNFIKKITFDNPEYQTIKEEIKKSKLSSTIISDIQQSDLTLKDAFTNNIKSSDNANFSQIFSSIDSKSTQKKADTNINQLSKNTTKSIPSEYKFGKNRESGIAGPDAIYIQRFLKRWSLRGPGFLKKD